MLATPIRAADETLADQQVATAAAEHAQTQIEITRDFLEDFAANLKTLADFGSLLYDFRDLKPPRDASPTALKYIDKILPMQDWLRQGGNELPNNLNLLSNIYDVIDSLRQDISRPTTNSLTVVVTSHTLESLEKMQLTWVTSNDVLQMLVDTGKISAPFAKYAGFLALGADDFAAGAGRLLGNHDMSDPETVTHLVDAANRAAWGTVGFLTSGGNPDAAKIYSDAANLVATVGRKVTLDAFVAADMKFGGAGAAILDQYTQAQYVRLAHNQPAQSFEQFINFDSAILRLIDPATRSSADARFGIRLPPLRDPDPTIVVTNTTHDAYREVCLSGFCTRTSVPDASARPAAVYGGNHEGGFGLHSPQPPVATLLLQPNPSGVAIEIHGTNRIDATGRVDADAASARAALKAADPDSISATIH
jgi:hypothetical protein